jgi:hypothetical protein
VIEAEVLAIIKRVEVVARSREGMDFEIRQDQAAKFAPFTKTINTIAFRVFLALRSMRRK